MPAISPNVGMGALGSVSGDGARLHRFVRHQGPLRSSARVLLTLDTVQGEKQCSLLRVDTRMDGRG